MTFCFRCASAICGLVWYGLVSANAVSLLPFRGEDDIDSPAGIAPELDRRNALEESTELKSMFPDWYLRSENWRKSIIETLRLEVTTSFDTVAQAYISGERAFGTMAGDLTLSGRYLAFGKRMDDPVFLAFRARYRSSLFGLDPPSQVRPRGGLLWGTVDGFTDVGFQVPDFYLTNELFDRRLMIRYGQLGLDSVLDGHDLSSGKRFFLSQAFSGHPGVGFPSFGTGIITRWKSPKRWDFTLGASNVQGTTVNDETNFDFDSEALFEAFQIGFNFKGNSRGLGRVQLMGWHSDELPSEDISEGEGVVITLEKESQPGGAQLFARYAYANGDATRTDHHFAIGAGTPRRTHDFFGVGLAVGRSAENNDIWQVGFETFFRWQITKELQITPDVQLVAGDSLDGKDSFRAILGLRGGLTF